MIEQYLSIRTIGLSCWFIHLCVAIYYNIINPVYVPKATTPITRYGYIIRFIAASCGVAVSILLAHISSILGGVLLSVPVMALVLMVGLFNTQTSDVVLHQQH